MRDSGLQGVPGRRPSLSVPSAQLLVVRGMDGWLSRIRSVSRGAPGIQGRRGEGERMCVTVCWGRGRRGLEGGARQWDEEKGALCARAAVARASVGLVAAAGVRS